MDSDFDWSQVWANIREALRNPDYEQIHFNCVHRTHLTPRKLNCMRLITDPLCSLCSMKASGTFLHMMWNCPPVSQFWSKASAKLSDLVSVTIPVTIPVLLLIDLSEVNIIKLKKRTVLAGLTAAKKLEALRWKLPHYLTIGHWALTFLDAICLELSTARINGASEASMDGWRAAADSLKERMR